MGALKVIDSGEDCHGMMCLPLPSVCCATRAMQCQSVLQGKGLSMYTGVRMLTYFRDIPQGGRSLIVLPHIAILSSEIFHS